MEKLAIGGGLGLLGPEANEAPQTGPKTARCNPHNFSIQESCGLEERRWEGILVGVELGCKSSIQCHSDISTNFIAATNQCRPTESGKSFGTK